MRTLEPWNEDINAKKIISVEDANYEVAKSKAGGFQAYQDSNPDLCARGGGGDSWEFLVGVCRWVLKIRPYFRTKNVIFQTRCQTWPLGRNYVSIT